jgi:hypothetical protein
MPFRSAGLAVAASAVLFLAAAMARSDVLFYGGGLIGEVLLENTDHPGLDSAIFDDFIVSDGGWKIEALTAYMGGYEMALPETAEWEIRRNMSVGDGGDLVASGKTTKFTWTATGAKGKVLEEYILRVDISDEHVVLPPGTYHMMLRPVMSLSELTTFLFITRGGNGIGAPLGNGNSLLHAPAYNYIYRDFGSLPGQTPPVDFRYTVEGEKLRKPEAKPEPKPKPKAESEPDDAEADLEMLLALTRLLFR